MKIKLDDFCEAKEMTACETLDNDYKSEIGSLKKKEKNRAAAYKIRQRHTQRADCLHQEFEKLEKDNAALRKEIQKLQQEQVYWAQVLQQHEETCLLLSPDIIMELLHPEPLLCPKERAQMIDI
ncbi:basic leucine zipper transcriptional factor ATF-like 2 isoform X2 [Mixophyes fleayi]|uniref:basic leucine zipper transcriptional factor ATF-like 2 isoform X2 n=1 Tax=Mixophyes fleayi TaxID=3061075 RepID=UPI003F4DAA85